MSPRGRQGYHAWRRAAAAYHADTAETILRDAGYGDETVRRVRSLLLKEGLGRDPETQTLEDAACLVFLEDELGAFAKKTDPEKLPVIIRRTWAKMSPRAREMAMALDLPAEDRALIEQSLEQTSS
ncbi:MAG: DUF4202 domain-containing protein [Deltaproteobacteria bacterium]|nr:DUF4202 domain-containing protein [Deltaproteobacteria bacterium]